MKDWLLFHLPEIRDWLKTNGDIVQVCSSLIQAGLSVLTLLVTLSTLIVTIIYVRATQRLVHLPHKPLIIPKGQMAGNSLEGIKIRCINSGPGVAINIKIFARITIKTNYETKANNLSRNTVSYADGQTEMAALKEEIFYIPGYTNYDFPFSIQCESISGKRYKSSWIGFSGPYGFTTFKRLNVFTNLAYKVKTIWAILKFPHLRNIYYRYLDYRLLEQRFLERLNSEGSMTYDYLCDRTKKSDEQVRKILSKMHKIGLIDFDGDEASITDLGKKQIDISD